MQSTRVTHPAWYGRKCSLGRKNQLNFSDVYDSGHLIISKTLDESIWTRDFLISLICDTTKHKIGASLS